MPRHDGNTRRMTKGERRRKRKEAAQAASRFVIIYRKRTQRTRPEVEA